MRLRALIAAVVALSALPVAPAAASRHKEPEPLWLISLSANIKLEWAETSEGTREPTVPNDCIGSATETVRFSASGQIAPEPQRSGVLFYGRNFPIFAITAGYRSLTANETIETAGSFAPDVTEPYPPTPSECAFHPKKTEPKCAFRGQGRLEHHEFFSLAPDLHIKPTAPLEPKNRLFIYGSEDPAEVPEAECGQELGGSFFGKGFGVPTKLRVGTLLSLRKGHSVTDSGTASFPEIGRFRQTDGAQTIAYALKVKRIR